MLLGIVGVYLVRVGIYLIKWVGVNGGLVFYVSDFSVYFCGVMCSIEFCLYQLLSMMCVYLCLFVWSVWIVG